MTPDDVRAVVNDCLRHRIVLSYEANAAGMTTDEVIGELGQASSRSPEDLVARKDIASEGTGGQHRRLRRLEDLVALEYKAKGYSFLPRQPVHSVLSGRHASRMRGRGLNFEELRGYLPGDDVRTIDWKVTARTREPHVRVYTEERDRPALLVVDQRQSMFFGSQRAMKSTVAAEVAALGAWRVLAQGDRVGALVFDDQHIEEIRPHRSRRTVLRILGAVVEKNHALHAESAVPRDPGMLNRALQAAERLCPHDYVVAIASDFDGVDDETERLVTRLAHGNDVVALPIWDPLTTHLPPGGQVVVSEGELQVEMDLGSEQARARMLDLSDQRLSRVLRWARERGVPVLPLTTAEEVPAQVRRLLGAGPRPGRP